jgi:hypothetical protein
LFTAFLRTRNIRHEENLVDQLLNSSEKRLARVLLILARFGKEGASESVIPKVNQETLAEMVGTTRSRVSFFMNRLRKLGFVNWAGGEEGPIASTQLTSQHRSPRLGLREQLTLPQVQSLSRFKAYGQPRPHMQQSGMLIHHCGDLGATVSLQATEIESRNAMVAEGTFECNTAIHQFGCVMSHFSIVVFSLSGLWASGVQPFSRLRKASVTSVTSLVSFCSVRFE